MDGQGLNQRFGLTLYGEPKRGSKVVANNASSFYIKISASGLTQLHYAQDGVNKRRK